MGTYKFQLTRSRGAWHDCLRLAFLPVYFNSHAHVERDLSKTYWLPYLCISTHTLTWSVTSLFVGLLSMLKFQLTRSRGAWHYLESNGDYTFNFNSHAHVERDNITKIVLMRLIISTHTLTWSVTVVTSKVMSIFSFQLTRSRGAWRQPTLACLGSRQFQLTRSRGAWPALVSPFEPVLKISTHTLTWSVTIDTPTTPFL